MLSDLKSAVVRSVVAVGAATVVCGVAYPVVVTAVAAVVCRDAAGGSLVVDGAGVVVGSAVVGQRFASARYLHGRPSATSPPYNAMASSGSNLGPTNPALTMAVGERVAALSTSTSRWSSTATSSSAVPIDLVTASASGLDPHVSPAAARGQAERIAQARGVAVDDVLAVIARHTTPAGLFFGEARVHVLGVNRDLDASLPQ